MAILCSSIRWALLGFATGAKLSFLICSSLIGLVIPVIFIELFYLKIVQVLKKINK